MSNATNGKYLLNNSGSKLSGGVLSVRKFLYLLVVAFAIMAISTQSVNAQSISNLNQGISEFHNKNIDIKIYFRWDKSYIDKSYMGNEQTLAHLDSVLRDEDFIASIDTIAVTALSSVEGAYSYNARLSERRQASLQRYIATNYPDIDSSKLFFNCMPENWVEFRELLANDSRLPSRDAVLSIVDSDKHYDTKERLLTRLDGGTPWRHITRYILPYQRYGASVLFIPKLPAVPLMGLSIEPISTDGAFTPAQPELTLRELPLKSRVCKNALFAIKTNLVWDAASVVNVGVEVPIGDRISVVAEVVHPWWRNWDTNFTMQIESYHGELKYWLGDRSKREKLTGWSLGVYGGWGRYDIQPFSETGVQGEFYDLGAEVGYAHPIARNLHLEYTLGLGYVSTTYYDYKMAYDTEEFGDIKVIPYPWMINKVKTPFPTRFGVSLVWIINSNLKGGKR